MPDLIVLLEKHFPGRVTYRGSAYLDTLIEQFKRHGLIERAQACPLGQFFKAKPFSFSGVLLHQLMLRKVESKKPEEGQFYLGNTLCRFGIAEFALVTGLNFGKSPSPDELKEHLSSDRIIQEYFNGDSKVSFGQLEDALKASTNPEDAFKLGLCYLIEGY